MDVGEQKRSLLLVLIAGVPGKKSSVMRGFIIIPPVPNVDLREFLKMNRSEPIEIYICQKARLIDDKPYGKSHVYVSGDNTICGLNLDGRWVIEFKGSPKNSNFQITCKICQAYLDGLLKK